MTVKIGFDNEKYLKEQTKCILERVEKSNNKLYLEFGGKIIFDYHASRVLPGFDPNVKMRLLKKLKDKADIILCIYAGDIERRKNEILKREDSETTRYKKYYNIDVDDTSIYDVVIDSSDKTPDEITEIIIKEIKR